MTNINNNYKRYQNFQNTNIQQNNFKHDFVEQNYKINGNKTLGEKRELGANRELPKQDNSFLQNATRLSVNSQGQFIKK